MSAGRKRRGLNIRAVISSGDSKSGVEIAESSDIAAESVSDSNRYVSSSTRNGKMDVRAVIKIRRKMKERLTEKIEDQWENFINVIGRGIMVQLISQDIDPGI